MELSELTTRAKIEAYSQANAGAIPRGHDKVSCNILGHFRMIVDTVDKSVAAHLINEGFWEAWITTWFINNIKPGFKCVDAGANYGYYTFLMSKLVGSKGQITAIEPNPYLVNCIEESISENGLNNITVHKCAVCDQDIIDLELSIYDDHICNANIMGDGDRKINVTGAKIDTVMKQKKVDFIKMDIEGAEEATWKGMQEIIRKNPKIQILMEIDIKRYSDPLNFLQSMNSVFPILRFVDYSGNSQPITTTDILNNKPTDWFMLLLTNK